MRKTEEKVTSKVLADIAIEGIQEKKGKQITLLNLKKVKSSITDYFIICHADSHRQVNAIADSVEDHIRKNAGEKPWHREGKENAEWVLLDYVNIVVHVFKKEAREFYNLEELWADAEIKEIEISH